ncbi:MAG: PepSY-like domain-containing protein [Bacteroidota bacterium]
MKIVFTLLTLATTLSVANAQTVKETEVPNPVKEALKKQYPAAQVEKWEKEGANFEAEFHVNKIETCAVYDSNGKFIESEIEIKETELPKAIADYVTKNLSGKKIKESAKITDAAGKVSYQAEIDNIDYIFDSNGSMLKKEEEKEQDSDKD